MLFSDYFCKDSDLMYTFRSYTITMDLVYSLCAICDVGLCIFVFVFLLYVFISTFLILCLSTCLSRFSYYFDVIGCAHFICAICRCFLYVLSRVCLILYISIHLSV